jgi:hypothetical protein
MDTLLDVLRQIFGMIWALVIIYLLIKIWNAFWYWLFPSE